MKKRTPLFILLYFCTLLSCIAQKNSFKITCHWHDDIVTKKNTAYLIGFHGDEATVYDSAVVKKNTAVFKGKELPSGFYQVILGETTPRDFVISESRNFTDYHDYAGHVEGSSENETYMVARFTISTEEGWKPDKLTLETLSHGHDLVYKYLVLEHLGLYAGETADPRLLRHPLFNKLAAEELQSEKIARIDTFFHHFGPDTEIGQYYLVQTLKYYNMDNNVAYDDILLHIYDTYYLPNHLQLFSENYERRLSRGVERKRHSAIGAEMPVIQSKTADGKTESTANASRQYTVVWFWDADCEDCLEETPILNRMYIEHQDDYDFEVYGYCITADINRWKKVSEEMDIQFVNTCDGLGGTNYDVIDYFNILTTPACLLIDATNKIIMRQFSLEELETFFNDLSPEK